MARPLERIGAYTTKAPGDHILIDTLGLAVDLIMTMKAGHTPKEQFMHMIAALWDEVTVEVDYSKVTRQ